MKRYIWQECLDCKSKICCKGFFPKSVFLTPRNKEELPDMNKKSPCAYLGSDGLCTVHNKKSVDCQLFPFDIISKKGKYFWVIWDVDCPIIKNDRKNFEIYLQNIEKNLMPGFKKYLKEFDEWKDAEYKNKFKYEIIREIFL